MLIRCMKGRLAFKLLMAPQIETTCDGLVNKLRPWQIAMFPFLFSALTSLNSTASKCSQGENDVFRTK